MPWGVTVTDGLPGVLSRTVFLSVDCRGQGVAKPSGFTAHLQSRGLPYPDLPGLALWRGLYSCPAPPTPGSCLSVCGQSSSSGHWPEWELQPPLAS